MTLPVRWLPEAMAEFDAAVDWYEQQQAGLGADLVARVQDALDRVVANPQLHAAGHGGVRKAGVRRFPYVVLYREEPGKLVIVSIFHTARDPSIWQSRVSP